MSEAGRRASMIDAIVYAGAGAGAVLIWLLASIPQYREWAGLAWAPYIAGAAAALLLRPRTSHTSARWLLAVAVFAGSALVPLALEVAWRANSGPGFHAQSETIITEEAARALTGGHDPYAATYLNGPLSERPLGTKTHFPYLPGMLLFGLPRALGGSTPLADARVSFALAGMAAAGGALRLARVGPDRRLRLFQAMLVLPTTALLMATGGDDVPVVCLMLLSAALLDGEHPVAAGLAMGAAAAMKQTAWILLPFLAVAAAGRRDRSPGSVLATDGSALAAAAAAIVPFVVWDPGAFVEDAILFPLGLGRQRSAAGTPTPGSLLVRSAPSARGLLTVFLLAVVAGVAVYLLVRRPPRSGARAALQAGFVFALAVLLAPAARTGYAIYPVCLIAWGLLSRETGLVAEPAPGPLRIIPRPAGHRTTGDG